MRHARTNYKGLLPFIGDMDGRRAHKRYQASGFMPLVFEYLGYTDRKGRPVFSMTHYGEQNGDAMRDPDMTLAVDREAQTVEPLTFQNDYLGLYQQVYIHDDQGRLLYSKRLQTSLDEFLWQWLRNIEMQGYQLERAGRT